MSFVPSEVRQDGSTLVTKFDPLKCPHCGGRMKIISSVSATTTIASSGSSATAACGKGRFARPGKTRPAASGDLERVPEAEFLQTDRLEALPVGTRLVGQSAQRPELRLALDPEYL